MLTELRAECSNCPPSLFRVYVPSRCYVVHSRSVNLTVSLWLLDLQLTLEIPRSLPISCLFAAELAGFPSHHVCRGEGLHLLQHGS